MSYMSSKSNTVSLRGAVVGRVLMVLRQLIALTAIVIVGSMVSGTAGAAVIRFDRDDFTIHLDH